MSASYPTKIEVCNNSYNCCAFPGCCKELKPGEYQIAHIISSKKNGPRHIDKKNLGEYNLTDYDKESNLIALCSDHHSEIDKNEQNYSIEMLQQMKKEHISRSKQLLNNKNPDSKFINRFLEICIEYSISELFKYDFKSPFPENLIWDTDYCSSDLNDLLNSKSSLNVNKCILTDISIFKDYLSSFSYNMSAICKPNGTGFAISYYSNNQQYNLIYESLKTLYKIYYNINNL